MLTSLLGNLPAMTCLRQLTSSLWMTGRQSGSLIISLSSLMVKATCSGPRLPTKYTFRTRLLESASRACWDTSVFYNTTEERNTNTHRMYHEAKFSPRQRMVYNKISQLNSLPKYEVYSQRKNERKSEQAHIPHAPTLPENAVYNEWQFQALVTGNLSENQFHLSCTK